MHALYINAYTPAGAVRLARSLCRRDGFGITDVSFSRTSDILTDADVDATETTDHPGQSRGNVTYVVTFALI